MNFKDQMRKDFETIFLNTDEFAETFSVIRNGSKSHEVIGIFERNNLLQVKLDVDIQPNDILENQGTLQRKTVQSTSRTSSCLNVHCR